MSANDQNNQLQQLLQGHELTQETQCERCGYDIYQHRLGSPSCVRCYPPSGFHLYSGQLFAIHPWKRQAIKEW